MKTPVSIREATSQDDFEFIVARCVAEAEEGHFSPVFARRIPDVKAGLQNQIYRAIADLPFPLSQKIHGTVREQGSSS